MAHGHLCPASCSECLEFFNPYPSGGFVICFSGCKDEGTSADVPDVKDFEISGTDPIPGAGGALTCALLRALEQSTTQCGFTTYARLLKRMRAFLRSQNNTYPTRVSSDGKVVVKVKGTGRQFSWDAMPECITAGDLRGFMAKLLSEDKDKHVTIWDRTQEVASEDTISYETDYTVKTRKYEQRPMLSTNVNFCLNLHVVSIHKSLAVKNFRALQVGVSYGPGGINSDQPGYCWPHLAGTHNDIRRMRAFMVHQGFLECNFKVLMDDGEHELPTRSAILAAIRDLVGSSQKGDTLFFQYSGHGGEVSQKVTTKQTIVPCDAHEISDVELHKELVDKLPKGVKLLCLFDSCHSASVMNLPYFHKYIDYESKADGFVDGISAAICGARKKRPPSLGHTPAPSTGRSISSDVAPSASLSHLQTPQEGPARTADFAERLDSVEKAVMNMVALSARELESQNHKLNLLQSERQQPADAAAAPPYPILPAPLPAEFDALGGRVGALEQSVDSLEATLQQQVAIVRHVVSGGQQRSATPGSDASPNGAVRSPAPPAPAGLDPLEARLDALEGALGYLLQRHAAEAEAAREAVAALEAASGRASAQVGRLEAGLVSLAEQRAADRAAQSLLVERVGRLEGLAGRVAHESPARDDDRARLSRSF